MNSLSNEIGRHPCTTPSGKVWYATNGNTMFSFERALLGENCNLISVNFSYGILRWHRRRAGIFLAMWVLCEVLGQSIFLVKHVILMISKRFIALLES